MNPESQLEERLTKLEPALLTLSEGLDPLRAVGKAPLASHFRVVSKIKMSINSLGGI